MDISDVLELIEEITDFTQGCELENFEFSPLRDDEIECCDIKISANCVPRVIK